MTEQTMVERDGPMSSSMIERVARASFKCWRERMTKQGRHLDKGQTFEDMSESELEFALLHARAAIEAAGVPDLIGALRVAREKLQIECGGATEYKGGMPTQILLPMIDAILKEQSE